MGAISSKSLQKIVDNSIQLQKQEAHNRQQT